MKEFTLSPLVVALCLAACPAASPSRAAEPRPSWECLPEDTAVMVRLPQPAAFLETMRTRTRLDRKSTRLNSSHVSESRMPSSA